MSPKKGVPSKAPPYAGKVWPVSGQCPLVSLSSHPKRRKKVDCGCGKLVFRATFCDTRAPPLNRQGSDKAGPLRYHRKATSRNHVLDIGHSYFSWHSRVGLPQIEGPSKICFRFSQFAFEAAVTKKQSHFEAQILHSLVCLSGPKVG